MALGVVLTQAGVLSEVPQELLALFLLVSAVPAATPRRDGEVRVISILVVRRHVRPFSEEQKDGSQRNALSHFLSHCLSILLSL